MLRRVAFALTLCLLRSSSAVAQTPVISVGGIVSAASYFPAGAPGYGVAPGSIVAIMGNNLASATALASAIPLPTSLGGTSLTIGGKTAALFFVSAGQVNAQVPADVSIGSQPVVVSLNGSSSAAVNVPVVVNAPGIFTAGQTGRGPGAIQDYVSGSSQPQNTFNAAIAPGGLIIVYGTGGGALQGGLATGVACTGQKLTGTAAATIGGVSATVEYAGCTPTYAGLDQYNIRVPNNIPAGCFLPLRTVVNGVGSNIVTIAAAPGGNCNTATTGSPGTLANQTVGMGVLSRTVRQDNLVGHNTTINSTFYGSFSRVGVSGIPGYMPPAGAGCLVEINRIADANAGPSDAVFLDAGTLTLTSPSGAYTMTQQNGGYGTGGTSTNGIGLGLRVDIPGSYLLAGSGGPNIGASGPVNLTISSMFSINSLGYSGGALSQTSSITSTWTCPDPNGEISVSLKSVNTTSMLSGSAYCTALCSDGKMTIPSGVLKQLPVSTSNGFSMSLSAVIPSLLTAPRITASGLDFGNFLYTEGATSIGTLNP